MQTHANPKNQILQNVRQLEIKLQSQQPAFLSNRETHDCEQSRCQLITLDKQPFFSFFHKDVVALSDVDPAFDPMRDSAIISIKPEEIWWCCLSNNLHICNEFFCERCIVNNDGQWVCPLTGQCYGARQEEGDAKRIYTIAAARRHQHETKLSNMRNGGVRNCLPRFALEANIQPYFREWFDEERFLQGYNKSMCDWQTRLCREQHTKLFYEHTDCWLDFGAIIAQRTLHSSPITPRLFLDIGKRESLVLYYSQRVLALWNMLLATASPADEILKSALKLKKQTVALLTSVLMDGVMCIQSGKVIVPAEDLLKAFGEIPYASCVRRRVRSDVTGACSLKQHIERILLQRLQHDHTLHVERYFNSTELLVCDDTATRQRNVVVNSTIANIDYKSVRPAITY